MLNIEYYKDKLKELGIIDLDNLALVQGKPSVCDDTECTECLFIHSSYCSDTALNWLLTEHEEEPEVPEVDWSKVKVDTPILVREYESGNWVKRYFAKFAHGTVYAWSGGATSWSADGEYDVNHWNYAKLAESEDGE